MLFKFTFSPALEKVEIVGIDKAFVLFISYCTISVGIGSKIFLGILANDEERFWLGSSSTLCNQSFQ
ncbi:hypothetical protein SDC9_162362 [bioreactor metagenome]|uniref:Uncharacterized protein n=1 Tax=bioreactor metagenome TaxID=1076179 RepID=A0A645FSH6_9ZZZZ